MALLVIFYTFDTNIKSTRMDALVFTLRDFFVWLFENTLEPLGNIPNYTFFILLGLGLLYWLKMQSKYNAEAEADPNQIK